MSRTSRRRHRERTFHRGYAGDAELAVRKLRAKGEHALRAAKQALMIGAYEIVSDAQSRCPVRTGKLRDSIKAEKLHDGAAYEITADATNEDGVAYGQFVEFSPQINQPFLYPALEANIDRIKHNMKTAIQNAVRQGG